MTDVNPTQDEDHDVTDAEAVETQAEVGGDAETPDVDAPEDDEDMDDDEEDEAPVQA